MTRPWVKPEEVVAYTQNDAVKKRDSTLLAFDIARAETYVIFRTHNDFTADAYKSDIPDDVRKAVIMLAEAYALKAIQSAKGTVQSETFDDYSYTYSDTDLIDSLGLGPLLSPYILGETYGSMRLKLIRL